jgi:hypothetical protein
MNRATFFKSLFFGAVSAPAIARVLAEEPVWIGKYVPPEFRINPAWESAPYEVHFACAPNSFKRMVPQRYVSGADYSPLRVSETGEVIPRFL